ncbi:MAG: hypothetical protein ACXQTI_07580 [Candidatus Nezhaarchaeales archaeon]
MHVIYKRTHICNLDINCSSIESFYTIMGNDVTIVWLILFALSFLELDHVLNQQIDFALLAMLAIFVADLIVKYLRVRDLREFFRKHWRDILATIPYFRFLRIARISRAIKLVKVAKTSRTSKW